jgi:hypothetical protein
MEGEMANHVANILDGLTEKRIKELIKANQEIQKLINDSSSS